MKPVYQTRFGDNCKGLGNCYAACLASVLEVNIKKIDVYLDRNDLPPYDDKRNRARVVTNYYRKIGENIRKLGFTTLEVGFKSFKERVDVLKKLDSEIISDQSLNQLYEEAKISKNIPIIKTPDECYCILSLRDEESESSKNGINHAVVGYIDKNDNIRCVHDPCPINNQDWCFQLFFKWIPIKNAVDYDLDKYCKSIEFLIKC